eukprot:c10303_g1_i1.p1 GENE.c10303_g1_i1~~c10303_g1_i1.p1  ORF type:complete len:186 (-),score=73.69 c10303_g1_i1:27-584(-)
MASSATFNITSVKEGDKTIIFNCVNRAYACELGDTGIAFKNENRFSSEQSAQELINAATTNPSKSVFFKAVTQDPNDPTKEILLGCIYGEKFNEKYAEFGPYAVDPSLHSKGVGTALLKAVEDWAISQKCEEMGMKVVNLRTDLFPFYEKRGYVRCGTLEWTYARIITRPCFFYLYKKALSKDSK